MTAEDLTEASALLAACDDAQAQYFWGYLGGLLEGRLGREGAAVKLSEIRAQLANEVAHG